MHPRLRAAGQRLAARAVGAADRLLEIRAGDPLAAEFAAFGSQSRIAHPRRLVAHPEAIAIGTNVTVLPGVALEAVHGDGLLIDIGDDSFIGFLARIVAINGIHLGSRVCVGHGVTISDTIHDYKTGEPGRAAWMAPLIAGRPLTIEDDVTIGVGSVVVGGITLGRGCIIGPNSSITRDVEPYTIVGVNPPEIRRRRSAEGEWLSVTPETG